MSPDQLPLWRLGISDSRMQMISYAQNLEDVLLHRALGHVSEGFYIDVGANDPIIDSVTKHFYELGWRGINIEPTTNAFKRLQEDRPRDINLQIGASDCSGQITIHHFDADGLSTSVAENVKINAARGHKSFSYLVPSEPLSVVYRRYNSPEVHFLKIDVEGAEEAVIRGIDFSEMRPWIILVEAIVPHSTTLNHHLWDPILTDAGYEFAIFDGLNRFYIAKEHQELKPYFAMQADRYTTRRQVELEMVVARRARRRRWIPKFLR